MMDAIIIVFAIIGAVFTLFFFVGLIVGLASYIEAHRGDEVECMADGTVYRGASGPLRMWAHDTFAGPLRRAAHRRSRAEWRARLGLPPR